MTAINNSGEEKIKVLVAKPGLDGHDRGAKVVVHALKEAGMETIYTGLHCSIEKIVATAIKNDADVIGMSIYSGAHLLLTKKLMAQLKAKGHGNKLVLIGGNVPEKDIDTLKKYGVGYVFNTGSSLQEIVEFIKKKVKK